MSDTRRTVVGAALSPLVARPVAPFRHTDVAPLDRNPRARDGRFETEGGKPGLRVEEMSQADPSMVRGD